MKTCLKKQSLYSDITSPALTWNILTQCFISKRSDEVELFQRKDSKRQYDWHRNNYQLGFRSPEQLVETTSSFEKLKKQLKSKQEVIG